MFLSQNKFQEEFRNDGAAKAQVTCIKAVWGLCFLAQKQFLDSF